MLVEKGYDPTMGARPLRRAIQRFIEDPLADFVLGAELMSGATILVDRREGEDEVEISVIAGEPRDELEAVTVPPEHDASDDDADSDE
jgi:ATP-dependent Clp protease ATP-binding subunit ClpC